MRARRRAMRAAYAAGALFKAAIRLSREVEKPHILFYAALLLATRISSPRLFSCLLPASSMHCRRHFRRCQVRRFHTDSSHVTPRRYAVQRYHQNDAPREVFTLMSPPPQQMSFVVAVPAPSMLPATHSICFPRHNAAYPPESDQEHLMPPAAAERAYFAICAAPCCFIHVYSFICVAAIRPIGRPGKRGAAVSPRR